MNDSERWEVSLLTQTGRQDVAGWARYASTPEALGEAIVRALDEALVKGAAVVVTQLFWPGRLP